MKFWRMHKPEYETDYQSVFVNGTAKHAGYIPAVACDACGEVSFTTGVTPVDIASVPQAPTLTPKQFDELCHNLATKYPNLSPEFIRPGTSILPTELSFASIPEADFFWSTFGSVIVSPRIRELVESFFPSAGVSFHKANISKIGKRNSNAEALPPSTGEPIDVVFDSKNEISAGHTYYEMIVNDFASPPAKMQIRVACETCNRQLYSGSKQILVNATNAGGHDLMMFPGTLYFVVSDRMKSRCDELGVANVTFSPTAV
jgi:hypothetical protein